MLCAVGDDVPVCARVNNLDVVSTPILFCDKSFPNEKYWAKRDELLEENIISTLHVPLFYGSDI